MNTIERIEARFRSGNSVPVERAHIAANEWAALKCMVATAGMLAPIATIVADFVYWLRCRFTKRSK